MIKSRTRKRDGRKVYDVRLRDPAGRVYTRTFLTKKEAEAYEADERSARNRGQWVDPRRAKVPFETVADEWLKDPAKRAGSVIRDRSILDRHIVPMLAGKPIGAVTRADVSKLVSSWLGRFAPATVLRHYACLRAVLSYAVAAEYIVRSPCREIRLPEVRPRTARILDADELERLAGAVGSSGPMVYLGALGFRWGEVAGLRVGHLDFLRQTASIARQRTRGEKGAMVEEDPKTKSGRRPVALPEWIMTMLAEHLTRRGLTGGDPEAHVFGSPAGAPLHYSNWRRRVWLPGVEKAELRGLTFHDLKHTAATALVQAGVDVKTVQRRLGHANPQTTLRIYAQATDEADRAAAKTVGDVLRPRDGRAMVPGQSSEGSAADGA